MTIAEDIRLSREQIDAYYRDGFISPLTAIPVGDMESIRGRIDREVLAADGPNPGSRLHCRHLDHHFLAELCRAPAIVGAARQLMGDDLQVWSTNFWCKEPGGTAVPWHQDISYWPLNPPLNLTAWLAIDGVDAGNSCVQVIAGSHRRVFDHRRVEGQMLGFEAVFDPDELPAPTLLELEPGQFALFNERLLHHSAPNRSDRRRLGFGVRIIPPFVQVDHDEPPLFPGHRCLRLCGEDHFGRNRT